MFNLNSILNSSATQQLLNSFLSGVPKFIMAIVLFLVGLFIAKIVAKFVKKILIGVNIDKLGEKLNEIEIIEKTNVKIKVSSILSKVVYYFLLLFILVITTDILDMPAVSDLVLSIFNLIPNIIVAGIILVLGTLVADMLRAVAQTTLESLGIPSARLLSSFVFYFLFINIIISALTQAQINTDFLAQNISLVIGGVVLAFAIGYGLASKGSMQNFLASYYSRGKFDVGDTITVDGETGKIVEIDKSSLILISENGNKVIFPLNHISNSKIEIHN